MLRCYLNIQLGGCRIGSYPSPPNDIPLSLVRYAINSSTIFYIGFLPLVNIFSPFVALCPSSFLFNPFSVTFFLFFFFSFSCFPPDEIGWKTPPPQKGKGGVSYNTVPKDWGNWITLKNIPWTIRFFPQIVLENLCTAINFKFCSH